MYTKPGGVSWGGMVSVGWRLEPLKSMIIYITFIIVFGDIDYYLLK